MYVLFACYGTKIESRHPYSRLRAWEHPSSCSSDRHLSPVSTTLFFRWKIYYGTLATVLTMPSTSVLGIPKQILSTSL